MAGKCCPEIRSSSASLRRRTLYAGAACTLVVVALVSLAQAQPCVVPDNGGGTVTLPPIGCDYLSPTQVHEIIAGLPPGTTIELAPIHKQFICYETQGVCSQLLPPGTCEALGGSLGGNLDCFSSTLQMQLTGTGALAGWARAVTIPIRCEVHTGPRLPGSPVQDFPAAMFRLQGQITGDPDFDLLRVTGGTDFGLPSPGHTTLTRLPDGTWNVESFFDITYRIDFVGSPGGPIGGMSGSTTATIRMQTGDPPPACGPLPGGSGCYQVTCPASDESCKPKCVNFNPTTGAVTVIDCACLGPNDCHVAWGKGGGDKGPRNGPCEVPDNGGGTVTLPPIGCDYLSPDQVHEIIAGLPPGTTIELAPIHQDFICRESAQGVCSLLLPPGTCEIPLPPPAAATATASTPRCILT